MSIIPRKILAIILVISLCACSFIGKTETDILKQAAITDARKTPEKLKLDYIKCYALENQYKQQCYEILSGYSENRKNATSWVYKKTYDNEMELQGFTVLLHNAGKSCDLIINEPELINKHYKLSCVNGKSYKIALNRKELSWDVAD